MRQLLSSPQFADEDKTLEARLLHIILLALFVVTAATFASPLLGGGQVLSLPALYLLLTAILGLIGGMIFLMRRGYVRLTSQILVGLFWILTTTITAAEGGVRAANYFGYFIVVALGGLLLGGRVSAVLTGLSAVAGLGMIYAGERGLLPQSSTMPPVMVIWFSSSAYLIILAVMQYLVTRAMRDALKRARASEAQYRMLVEQAPDGICLLDDQNRILLVNSGACHILGYAAEELIGQDGTTFIDPEHLLQNPIAPRETFNAGQTIQQERVLICKDGSRVWVLGSAKQMPDGRTQYVFQDITERKRDEEETQRRVAVLRAVHEIGLNVSAQLDLPILLQTLLERVTRLLNAPIAGLYILQADGQTLEDVAAIPGHYIGSQIQLGEGVAGRVAQSGEPLIVGNYRQWPGRAAIYDSQPFGAIVGVPIKWQNQVLGVLDIGDYSPDLYGTEEVETLQLLASQAAVAIQNARLFEAEQRRVALFTALHETGLDLSAQLDLPTLLRTIMERAVRLLDAPMGGLYLLRPEKQMLEPVANLPPEDIGKPVSMGEGLIGRVAESGDSLIVADYGRWPGRLASLGAPSFRSVVGVPIKWQDQALGVVSVCDIRPARFGPSDAEIVRLFASQAAVAIKNAQLFEATRRQLAELEVLNEMAVAGAEAVSEEILIERATRIIGKALYPDAFGVGLIDPSAGVLRWVGGMRNPAPVKTGMLDSASGMLRFTVPLGKGVTGQVAATGQPRRVADISQEPDYVTITRNRAMLSEICVPIKLGDQVLGVIDAESGRLGAFSEADERLLLTFAGQLATALDGLRAETKIRKLNAELEQRVIERTAQLKAVNRELEAFSYSVSHDLRAPLRSIDGFSQALLEDYGEALTEEGRRYLNIVRTECQHMGQLIDDLINLARVSRVEMHHSLVNLSEMAESIIAALRTRHPERAVDFTAAPGLVTQGDINLLRIMLDNLLGNAWKFTSKQPLAKIELGIERQADGTAAFFVCDNGVGFDMTYADKLFGAFQRLHSQAEFEGSGIGLATVQRVLNRHNGQAWAKSTLGQGATFYFTLPVSEQQETL